MRSSAIWTWLSPSPDSSLILARDTQGRVFFQDAMQRGPHLIEVRLAARGHGDREYRLRKFNASESERSSRIGQRITGPRDLELGDRSDVSWPDLSDRRLLLAAHDEQLADALGLAALWDGDLRIGPQGARVDANIGQFPDEGIGDRLEHDCSEWSSGVGSEFDRLPVIAFAANHSRGWKVIDDRVEERESPLE
jgi:hypothetical protein